MNLSTSYVFFYYETNSAFFLPFRFDAADKGEDFDKTVEDIKSKPKED